MTTLAADKPRDYGLSSKIPGVCDAIASDIIYEGAAVGESASTGTGRPLAAGDVFLGFAKSQCDNSAGAAGAKRIELWVKGLVDLPITGAATANVGDAVYASDDDTFTFSSTGNTQIGKLAEMVPGKTAVARVYFEAARYQSI